MRIERKTIVTLTKEERETISNFYDFLTENEQYESDILDVFEYLSCPSHFEYERPLYTLEIE